MIQYTVPMRILLLFWALPLCAQLNDNRLAVTGDAEIKVAPDRVVHQVTDPIAGFLVDVVEAEMECSSGMVIAPTTPDGGIEIRELHDGKVQNDEVQVTDKDVQAHLVSEIFCWFFRGHLRLQTCG